MFPYIYFITFFFFASYILDLNLRGSCFETKQSKLDDLLYQIHHSYIVLVIIPTCVQACILTFIYLFIYWLGILEVGL
jgi:hypothetical protein